MANKRIRKKRAKQQKKNTGNSQCVLCGKTLSAWSTNYISGSKGAVCHRCIRTGYLLTSPMPVKEPVRKEQQNTDILTPQELMDELDRSIAGQDEAKRAVALAMWKQQLKAKGEKHVPASHLLLYGPTGCGKTMLAKKAAKLAGLPYIVFDSTTLSETGYKGRDAAEILKDYRSRAEGNTAADYGVIILDEIDKLAAKGNESRQAYNRGTQHSLLKLLEENEGLLFVLCGAFHGLYDQKETVSNPIGFNRERPVMKAKEISPDSFVAYGMERELMGRVPRLARIHGLKKEDLVHILMDKDDSAFEMYQVFFHSRGVRLELTVEAAEGIAERTLRLGTGARGLKAELDKVMEPLMMKLAEGELEEKVVIRDEHELRAVYCEAG